MRWGVSAASPLIWPLSQNENFLCPTHRGLSHSFTQKSESLDLGTCPKVARSGYMVTGRHRLNIGFKFPMDFSDEIEGGFEIENRSC